MTKAYSSTPLWPYLGVIACLLVLTMLAPRTWRESTRDQATFGDSEAVVVSAPSIGTTTGLNTRTEWTPATDSSHPGSATLALSDFIAPRQIAQIAPPVTERIEFDPSVGDLPSLPVPGMVVDPARASIGPRLSPPPTPVPSMDGSVEKKAAETSPLIATHWPLPKNLVGRLTDLAQMDECHAWADRVLFTLDQLHRTHSFTGNGVVEHLNSLDASVADAAKLAQGATHDVVRTSILRTRYALQRRIEIWRRVHAIIERQTVAVSLSGQSNTQLVSQIKSVREHLDQIQHGDAWNDYLLLNQLESAVESGAMQQQRNLARRILERTESPRLKDRQIELLVRAPFSGLTNELRLWATEPVDYAALLDNIEAYEATRPMGAATDLARLFRAARWSSNEAIADLADTLNAHYRNANLRVAVSSDLLNRLLPPVSPTDQDIDEVLLGARIYGRSRTKTNLKAVLVPDGVHWRVGLEASGEVETETAANAGPATFYNEALSQYLARKLMLADRNGVVVWGAEAEAESETGLQGVETDFDGIPILEWLARSIAVDEHNRQFRRARRIAEERLAERASERLDEEVHVRLKEGEQEFKQKLLDPMRGLKLNPIALDMYTTKDRLIGRYRLAGDHQLGAHTPRPRAPTNSLLSVQVHESAFNNVLQQLQLDGKESDLRQLYADIAASFSQQAVEVPEEIPTGVTLRFAEDEAVRVCCEQGRVVVTIRIAELKRGRRNRWTNFAVRAYYVADSTQLEANLVREGTIELAGRHIRVGDRLVLSGIFSKALSRSRPFRMINRGLSESAALQDLRVTQFVITDGWVGVALGPQEADRVEHLAEKPESSTVVR